MLTAVLGVASLVSRLWGISYPADKLFDEAYYPPEAHELLTWGFEYNRGYSFIVHPPLGKWMIAIGEQLFGYNSFGWRFPSAVAGAVAVVVLTRLARRLTGSTLLGLLAGLLLALDGFSFSVRGSACSTSSSRCSPSVRVACLVVDRDTVRARIRAMDGVATRLGPRGWRIAAGFLFGCACAVKWSGVWFLAFFAVLSLFWDRAAWREAGVPRPTRTVLRRGLPGAVWALGAVPVLTYLAASPAGSSARPRRARPGRSSTPHTAFPFVPDALRSLWHEHAQWLTFHNNLSTPHPWESGPWSWLVDGRPILLWNPQGLTDADGAPGDPLHPDDRDAGPLVRLRAGAALAGLADRRPAGPGGDHRRGGIAAGWLTWFINLERTMFIFYMAPVVPFFVLAVTLALQDAIGRPDDDPLRRQVGLGAVCLYVALVAATFVFFYPVLTGDPLTHAQWLLRMWFPSWF